MLLYDTNHHRLRSRLEPKVAAGGVICPTCLGPILPGQPWDLGHGDGPREYLGPQHRACNRRTAGRKEKTINGSQDW